MSTRDVERNRLKGRTIDHERFGCFNTSRMSDTLGFAVVKTTAAVAEAWRTMMGDQTGYRPEAHYMRGPGPKWRAKHAQVSTRTEANS